MQDSDLQIQQGSFSQQAFNTLRFNTKRFLCGDVRLLKSAPILGCLTPGINPQISAPSPSKEGDKYQGVIPRSWWAGWKIPGLQRS